MNDRVGMRNLERWAIRAAGGLIGLTAMFLMVSLPSTSRAAPRSAEPMSTSVPLSATAQATEPSTPQMAETRAAPLILFADDFSTRADRWRIFDTGKAAISYDTNALRLSANPSNYALWTVPDTDLRLDALAIEAQFTWTTGGDDAQAGVILSYHNENDMLAVTVTRDGTVRIGSYKSGVWADLTPPQTLSLTPDAPIDLRAVLGNGHQLSVYADDQAAQSVSLDTFKAGSFGLFAINGASGTLSVAFQNLTVSTPE